MHALFCLGTKFPLCCHAVHAGIKSSTCTHGHVHTHLLLTKAMLQGHAGAAAPSEQQQTGSACYMCTSLSSSQQSQPSTFRPASCSAAAMPPLLLLLLLLLTLHSCFAGQGRCLPKL
jgi:hypothetical protein